MENITLIIPAKEEPSALPMVLDEIKKKNLSFKILVIIHKSDTETYEAIKSYDCEVLFQTQRGYGNAIIEGINHSKTKYSCIFYADGSTDPIHINQMLEKLQNQNLDLIFGSRYEKNANSFDDDIITRIGNYGFTFLGNFLMKFNISDILFTYIFAKTECFKNMKLVSNDFCLCIEIPYKAKVSGLNYSTVPCIERKRFADKKKVKAFSDGFKILKYLFSKYLNIINTK
jgi:glycosyltransferase involved in cell wall biosynthesis